MKAPDCRCGHKEADHAWRPWRSFTGPMTEYCLENCPCGHYEPTNEIPTDEPEAA